MEPTELEPIDVVVSDSRVVYTTKELLTRIDKRFDRLEDFAANAASRTDVAHLEGRVTVLEKESAGTKAVAKALLDDGNKRWSKRQKVAAFAVSLLMAYPTLVELSHLAHQHHL